MICCFGATQREFIPTVRMSDRQLTRASTPRERTSSGARRPMWPARTCGRAAFMGKVGDDDFGNDLESKMSKIDEGVKTAASYMRITFREGRMVVETVKDCAEDSMSKGEVDAAILKEAKIFRFNSVLLSLSMHPALFTAIVLSKKYNNHVFFDLNLPLPLWKSRDETT